MNYEALMAFQIFAEHLNFTRAARALYISQPALHAKVTKLASELELELYVRRGRSLVLTGAGEKLAAHAREVKALSEDVLAELQDNSRGTVALASGQGSFMYLLGPVLEKTHRGAYPLRLMTMNSTEAAVAVNEARAHVAFGVFHANPPPGLEITAVREVGQMVVLPENHHLATKTSLAPEDLEGESLIIAPEGMPHRISTAQVLDERGVSWEVAVEATGWELMMRFVSYGMGISVVNDSLTTPDGVIGIPIEGFPTIRYDVAISKSTPHKGALWLRDLIVEMVGSPTRSTTSLTSTF